MCGVSYGEIDVDRLINALTLVARSRHRRAARRDDRERTVRARVAAVREVSDVPERVLASRRAERDGDVQAPGGRRARRRRARRGDARRVHRRGPACTTSAHARRARCSARCGERRLYKRAFECPAATSRPTPPSGSPTTARSRSPSRTRSPTSSASQPGELLLDYPAKTQMLGLDLLVQRPYGEVRRLTAAGWEGAINLPKLSEEFYRSARWLRVYTAPRVRDRLRECASRLASRSGGRKCGRD